jgi:hypothetical protein
MEETDKKTVVDRHKIFCTIQSKTGKIKFKCEVFDTGVEINGILGLKVAGI